jgi:hypothetical protein
VKIGCRKPSRRPSNFPRGAIKGELSAYINFLFLFWLVANIKRMWFVKIQRRKYFHGSLENVNFDGTTQNVTSREVFNDSINEIY